MMPSLTEVLYGGRERGLFRARVDGRSVLVTLGPPQRKPLELLKSELAMRVPGVTPLLHLGGHGPAHTAAVEAEPAGHPAGFTKVELATAIARTRALIAIIQTAHAQQVCFGYLRPELIYVDGERVMLAPRCERFLASAQTVSGVAPCFDHLYAAPELLANPQLPIDASADVFSLAAILAVWATGRHPFAGDGAAAQLISVSMGERNPWDGNRLVGSLVDKALSPAPTARPSIAAMAGLLEDLADLL